MKRRIHPNSRLGTIGSVLGLVLAGCDAQAPAPYEDGPGFEDARVSTFSAPLSTEDVEPGLAGPGCKLAAGPWSRGAVLGPGELAELAAQTRERCPHLDLEGRVRPDERATTWRHARLPDAPPVFCTTGRPPSPTAAGTLPGREDELAVIGPRFESEVDLGQRLAGFRETELVDLDGPGGLESLVGVDALWRAETDDRP